MLHNLKLYLVDGITLHDPRNREVILLILIWLCRLRAYQRDNYNEPEILVKKEEYPTIRCFLWKKQILESADMLVVSMPKQY
ncbi:hypothetical protein Spica_1912 [Gracilinema caldarium DSM 7334]|uniref:Uncharacterized protein n=1 Tax=Gracilinema caldarium (strain ATCC 51460 / DSM 7334 / H1) TaxID=744872 RepID=F8F426_GRAC1|nr:hypothetical protein Spica_1912 [Gracilinema caldarium DSM 7334]